MADPEIPLEHANPHRHELCRAMLSLTGAVGAGARVGVIDSGVDPDWLGQQGLVGRPAIQAHDFTRNVEGWREQRPEPHGSRIVADILRSAPLAAIESLRVHGNQVPADRADIVRALEWCGAERIPVVNLSLAFYQGCSDDCPCVLCRSINSAALATGMFVAISSGDAVTIGEAIDAGETPLQCPAARAQVAWSIASPEVITPKRILLHQTGGGLSFTTGKFTAGIAQLRGAYPTVDLFTLRRCVRRTCVPSPHLPDAADTLGRHCFLLAWLALGGLDATEPGLDLAPLASPSGPGKQGVDHAVLRALQRIAAGLLLPQRWDTAGDVLQKLLAQILPWAGPAELALTRHMLASCHEARGRDDPAAAEYVAAEAQLQAWLAALPAASASASGAAQ